VLGDGAPGGRADAGLSFTCASLLYSTIHAAACVTCAITGELSRRFAVRLVHTSCEIRLSITLCVTVPSYPVVCRDGHLLNAGYRTRQNAFIETLLLKR
jgi:hypothetical protein